MGDGDNAGLCVVNCVRKIQVHGGCDGGIGVSVLFHIKSHCYCSGNLLPGGILAACCHLCEAFSGAPSLFCIGLKFSGENPSGKAVQGVQDDERYENHAHADYGESPAVGA